MDDLLLDVGDLGFDNVTNFGPGLAQDLGLGVTPTKTTLPRSITQVVSPSFDLEPITSSVPADPFSTPKTATEPPQPDFDVAADLQAEVEVTSMVTGEMEDETTLQGEHAGASEEEVKGRYRTTLRAGVVPFSEIRERGRISQPERERLSDEKRCCDDRFFLVRSQFLWL